MKNNKLNNELIKLIHTGQKIVIQWGTNLVKLKDNLRMKITTWGPFEVYFALHD